MVKVTTKYCCYGNCKTDSQALSDSSGIYFIGF